LRKALPASKTILKLGLPQVKMPLLQRLLILLAAGIGAAIAGNPRAVSCETCTSTVAGVFREWQVAEPGLLSDLPPLLCESCPVEDSCMAVVRMGIQHTSEIVNSTDPKSFCSFVGLCNATDLSEENKIQ